MYVSQLKTFDRYFHFLQNTFSRLIQNRFVVCLLLWINLQFFPIIYVYFFAIFWLVCCWNSSIKTLKHNSIFIQTWPRSKTLCKTLISVYNWSIFVCDFILYYMFTMFISLWYSKLYISSNMLNLIKVRVKYSSDVKHHNLSWYSEDRNKASHEIM